MRILIADDDKLVCALLSEYVSICNHEVVATVSSGGLSVIQSCAKHRPDVVLLDVLMPQFNGFTVCRTLRSSHPEAKVILMSGQVDASYPSITACGASGFLRKPMLFDEVRLALESLDLAAA